MTSDEIIEHIPRRPASSGAVATHTGATAPRHGRCLKQITQLLPKLILIKAEQAQNLARHTTLQLLASEMADRPPVWEVVANRLAEVHLQAIRAHVASGGDCRNHGWLRAIFDPQIGRR